MRVGPALVGKCPRSMTIEQAEELLNAGIVFPVDSQGTPQRIYVVHEGTVYRATHTNPGVSFHGFPEMIERLPPDRTLRARILERAQSLGCGEEVARWMHSKQTTV